MTQLSQPRIVCAANELTTGHLLIGARHWDIAMRSQAEILAKALKMKPEDIGRGETQGFIDQHGVFYDRYEAWEIAEANGQIINRRPGCEGPELFSENLY